MVKACSNPSIVQALFSATLHDFVEELARSIMHEAVKSHSWQEVRTQLLNQSSRNLFLLELKKGNFLHYVKDLQRRIRFVILA
ncbi:hypothetical protein WN944_003749 [Citrus x changshan-huyou]|uniref:Uncharacterized protein n=1 Tax=Citrus x changshan-huyou TaxID=2935761 RepID=A0AAP0LZ73_9ROSI